MLFGISKGSTGMIGRMATMVSSSGLTRTVSFQPSSVGSGGMMMLSQVTRLSTCTSYRWKWIGCVSTPLWVNFQICVPSVRRRPIGVTSDVVLRQVGGVDELRRRVHERVQDDVLRSRRGRDGLDADVARHPAVLVEGRRVHLVVDRLGLDRDAELLAQQGVELEGVAALLIDPGEPVAVGAAAAGALQSLLEAKLVP